MAITTRQLIRGSLRLLGAVESGENVEANETADALEALNALLLSWSLERLHIFHISRLEVPTVPGQQTYTWGPGGNIVGARPLRLERALINLGPGSGSGGTLEWPISVWTQDEYESGLRLKQLGSTIAWGVYLEESFPLARLHVWPVPTLTTTRLILFPWLQLMSLPTLDTLVDFPPGYERLLRYGLAVELAPEYGREAPTVVVMTLAEAKSAVKRMNTKVPLLGQPVQAVSNPYGLGASRHDIRRGTL